MSESANVKRYMVRFEDGTTSGPLDKSAIKALVQSGRLRPNDRLATEGTNKWTSASDIRGLFQSPEPSASPARSKVQSQASRSQPQAMDGSTAPSIPPGPETERVIPRSLVLALVLLGVISIGGTFAYVITIQLRSSRHSREMEELRAAMSHADELASSHSGEEAWQVSLGVIDKSASLASSGNPNAHSLDGDMPGLIRRCGLSLLDARLVALRTSIQSLSSTTMDAASLSAAKQESGRVLNDAQAALRDVQATMLAVRPSGVPNDEPDSEVKTREAAFLALGKEQAEVLARQTDRLAALAAKQQAVIECLRTKVKAEIAKRKKSEQGNLLMLAVAGDLTQSDLKRGLAMVQDPLAADASLVEAFDARVLYFKDRIEQLAMLVSTENTLDSGAVTALSADAEQAIRKIFPECWSSR